VTAALNGLASSSEDVITLVHVAPIAAQHAFPQAV
jgi:hypothetical protein